MEYGRYGKSLDHIPTYVRNMYRMLFLFSFLLLIDNRKCNTIISKNSVEKSSDITIIILSK